MTLDEVLAKRNQVRETRNKAKNELTHFFEDIARNALVEKMTNAEYSWGYWDGIISAMQKLKLKEINV